MIRRRLFDLVIAITFATGCTAGPLDAPDAGQLTAPTPSASALAQAPAARGRAIPNAYIVGFRAGVKSIDAEAHRLEARHRGVLRHTYRTAMHGMAITMSDADAAAMRADSSVAFVEQDEEIHVTGTQANAPWNLDRIDQRALPLDGSYSYTGDGKGVTVYIIDTGINFTHVDFGGRAVTGTDIITPGGTAADCYGHGTHVAGIVGGSTYGVAKQATLVAVRVVDCNGNGSNSLALAGVDWVTQHHVAGSVANVSLGGGYSAALNQGITNSIASGVTYVVAAGNNGGDACNYSPSGASGAIAVSATNSSDAFVAPSNYGSCVALLAPGSGITSDYIGSTTATATLGGTSMASPHVAGLAALVLQAQPGASPAQVRSALINAATAGKISGVPQGTPNLFAYGAPQSGPAPGNQAPVARFSATCPGRQCTFDARASTDDAGIVSYAWTWGDGRSETKSNPVTLNTFATNGTYTVTLTVRDAGGLTNSTTRSVTVPTPTANQPPTVSIAAPAASSSATQGQAVTFSGSANDPETGALSGTSLRWTSSIDGAIGSGTSFTTSTLSVGTHTVTLTATDPQGASASVSTTITITAAPPVNKAPVARFTVNCVGQAYPHQCALDASSSSDDAGITSYMWNWGNGRTETKVSPYAKNTWSAAGSYTITLTVTDGGGLTNSLSIVVNVP